MYILEASMPFSHKYHLNMSCAPILCYVLSVYLSFPTPSRRSLEERA